MQQEECKMIYVMSDIHGCFEKYEMMKNKIGFSKEDMLYILGDVVDRGPSGMKVLLDIAQHENILLLRGNHDLQAMFLLSRLQGLYEDEPQKELVEAYQAWFSDGGSATVEEYLTLSEEEKALVLKVLGNSLMKQTLEINGNRFLLAHTVPEVDVICDFDEWSWEAYLYGEPDYEEIYFDDTYVVTGHTPTQYIDCKYNGKIWMGNHHIAVDCGAVFGNPLGCICLDTFETYYVDESISLIK